MLRNILLLFISFFICSCAGKSQTSKLVGYIKRELKENYSIEHGEVVAKFDLEEISKKNSLFAPYYGAIVNNSSLNKKFLSSFTKKYRHQNLIETNSYKKLGMLSSILLELDKKYHILSNNLKRKVTHHSLEYKKNPEFPKKINHNYYHQLVSLHEETIFIPLYPSVDRAILTSKFGPRKHPKKKKVINHNGIDLVGKHNSKIYASANGVVTEVARKHGYGNTVIIKHSSDISTLYAHLSKIDVKEGDRVLLGEAVGNQGSSGTATGPHLHFEVIIRGNASDPLPFVSASL